MKKYLAAAAVITAFAATPALAEDMKCDEASMAAVQKMIDGATDPAMKDKVEAAKVDLKSAMDAKTAANDADCAAALTKASQGLTAQ
jgi:hypothetical protein